MTYQSIVYIHSILLQPEEVSQPPRNDSIAHQITIDEVNLHYSDHYMGKSLYRSRRRSLPEELRGS
jgi:hypothetical protein